MRMRRRRPWLARISPVTVVLSLGLALASVTSSAIMPDAERVSLAEARKNKFFCEPCGGFYPGKVCPGQVNVYMKQVLVFTESLVAFLHQRPVIMQHKETSVRKHRFRIVGGKRSIKSRPWMVFIQILEDNRWETRLMNVLLKYQSFRKGGDYMKCQFCQVWRLHHQPAVRLDGCPLCLHSLSVHKG